MGAGHVSENALKAVNLIVNLHLLAEWFVCFFRQLISNQGIMASKLAIIFLAVFAVAMVTAKPGQGSEAYRRFKVSSISLGAPWEKS